MRCGKTALNPTHELTPELWSFGSVDSAVDITLRFTSPVEEDKPVVFTIFNIAKGKKWWVDNKNVF